MLIPADIQQTTSNCDTIDFVLSHTTIAIKLMLSHAVLHGLYDLIIPCPTDSQVVYCRIYGPGPLALVCSF